MFPVVGLFRSAVGAPSSDMGRIRHTAPTLRGGRGGGIAWVRACAFEAHPCACAAPTIFLRPPQIFAFKTRRFVLNISAEVDIPDCRRSRTCERKKVGRALRRRRHTHSEEAKLDDLYRL